jgi:hypothetical protein
VGNHEFDAPEAKLHTIPRWRRPFGVHALHPAIGAAWAKEAGCEPLAVWLIANHQDEINPENGVLSPEQELLRVLQWADGKN